LQESLLFTGLCPEPHFILFLEKKERSKKIQAKTIATSLCCNVEISGKAGQASLPKFHTLQHSHPRLLRVLARPPQGVLNRPHHNACGAKNKFLIQTVFRSNEDEARLYAR